MREATARTSRTSATTSTSRRFSGGRWTEDGVFALHESARILPRRHVAELQVRVEVPEQGNAGADENRHPGDDETLDEPGPQESLNGDPAIDVGVAHTLRGQPRRDLGGRAGH